MDAATRSLVLAARRGRTCRRRGQSRQRRTCGCTRASAPRSRCGNFALSLCTICCGSRKRVLPPLPLPTYSWARTRPARCFAFSRSGIRAAPCPPQSTSTHAGHTGAAASAAAAAAAAQVHENMQSVCTIFGVCVDVPVHECCKFTHIPLLKESQLAMRTPDTVHCASAAAVPNSPLVETRRSCRPATAASTATSAARHALLCLVLHGL